MHGLARLRSTDTPQPAIHAETELNGQTVVLDPAGAIYLPDHGLLCVSDLHLEKGAAYARRGQLLPPWDTFATLKILGMVIARHNPRFVVSLGY